MSGSRSADHSASFTISIPCSAHDETKTSDGLYGPGRTVGKMLNFGGRHIDRLLGRATTQWSQVESCQYDGRFFREPGCVVQATQRHISSTEPDSIEVSFVCDADGDKYEIYDHLYGPGRGVNKMLNFGGRHIDLLLSKATERMGYGPRVVAHRISRIGAVIEHSILHYERQFCQECPKQKYGCNKHFCRGCDEKLLLLPSEHGDEKRLRKDCKRLLKYAKSHAATTQKQALDRILDLLVELNWIRDLFKDVGAIQVFENSIRVYENFRFGNSDPLLLSRSRKALVCLRDTKLNVLIRKWVGHGSWGAVSLNHLAIWDEISTFLCDLERAFLVIRCLRRLAPTPNGHFEANITCHVISSVTTSPGHFEWEECSALFKVILDKRFGGEFGNSLSILLEYAMRNVDKMPQLLWSDTFKLAMAEFDTADHFHSVISFLLRRSLVDVIVQERGKVLSLDVLKKAYPCQLLEPLLRFLVCPIEAILAKFVVHTMQFESTPSSEETAAYSEIARFLDSPDNALRERALKYVNFFLRLDTYRCEAMSQALSSTRYARTVDFEEFRNVKRRECVPMDPLSLQTVYRFSDETGIHVFDTSRVPRDLGRMIEEITFYGWIWFTLYDDSDISAAGLHPVLAGHSKNGKRAYLTWCHFKVPCGCEKSKFAYATMAMEEDTKLDDLRIEVTCRHGRMISKPIEARLIILRYAPDIFPASYGGDEPGTDATGPFSWRPLHDYDRMKKWRRLPYSVRFIPVEDDEAGEEGPDTGQLASEDDESMEDTPANDSLSLDQSIRHEAAYDDDGFTSDETTSCSSESDDNSVFDLDIRKPLPPIDMMQIARSTNAGESDGPETNCSSSDVTG